MSPSLFSSKLISWSLINPRTYPWTGEKDPYRIWISEIILQQTRSEQGKPYYENFIKKFPSVSALHAATEDEVLTCWQGLGYYSRARNLHAAAHTIIEKHQGKFPVSHSEIRSLKGIGDYTAAAISSFAFNSPFAVVDGNVVRVLSRIFGIRESFTNSQGKKYFHYIANKFLDKKQAATYNQAIMDFGAIQCKAQNPVCTNCIFINNCKAYKEDRVESFPVKLKSRPLKQRYFHYLLLRNSNDEIVIQKRTNKDIWQNLFELPLIETKGDVILNKKTYLNQFGLELNLKKHFQLKFVNKDIQKLTHQQITGRFYIINNPAISSKIKQRFYFVKPENLVNFAFPKIVSTFLEQLNTH